MEVMVRVPLFYVLDNTFNDILSPHPNSCSSITNQSDSCLPEKLCSNSAKINPLYLLIISSCLILVTTTLQNVVKLIKWLFLLTLLCFYYYGAYSCVILSNPSAMALRVTICIIVFYSIYQQIDVELRATISPFSILRYLIPLTIWMWSLHYLYDENNVVLSHLSLTVLRLANFFIASFAMIMLHQEYQMESRVLLVVICFLLFTFGLRTTEFQYYKYGKLISLMRDMVHKSGETRLGQLRSFLINLTIFIIQLSSLKNYFPRTLSGLMEWNFLQEICNTESIIILRYIIIYRFLSYFNMSILKAVNSKLFQNCTSEISKDKILMSPLTSLIFAIDGQFLDSNAENRWNIGLLTTCFLINCGALLFSICDLIIDQKEKKHHYKTLGLSLFTFIGAILLLGVSLWTVPLGAHLFIIVSFSIYVIVVVPLKVLGYFLKYVEPYNDNVEAPHRSMLMAMIVFGILHCLFISLYVTMYLMATHKSFGLHVFRGAIVYLLRFHSNLRVKYWVFINYVRIRIFIHVVGEAKPEALKKLNDMCSICRGEMMVSGCVTSCKHYYHRYCLLSWLYKSNTCPMCQNELYALYSIS